MPGKPSLKRFEKKLRVRQLRESDFHAVVPMQKRCFPTIDPRTEEQFKGQLERCPEGQICVDLEGVPIASSSSLIVDFDLHSEWHDWKAISSDGAITNHDAEGDCLYGI